MEDAEFCPEEDDFVAFRREKECLLVIWGSSVGNRYEQCGSKWMNVRELVGILEDPVKDHQVPSSSPLPICKTQYPATWNPSVRPNGLQVQTDEESYPHVPSPQQQYTFPHSTSRFGRNPSSLLFEGPWAGIGTNGRWTLARTLPNQRHEGPTRKCEREGRGMRLDYAYPVREDDD